MPKLKLIPVIKKYFTDKTTKNIDKIHLLKLFVGFFPFIY